jgi:hypothetical protein
MSDKRQFTLRQIDQTRGDLYAIQDEIECMKAQLARLRPAPISAGRC